MTLPDWVSTRPATTVMGDSRLWPPGHKVNADDRRRLPDADDRYGDRAGTRALRITVAEAATLQGFPADHPWRGTVGQQRQQIGNAVPPPLAYAILTRLTAGATPVSTATDLFAGPGGWDLAARDLGIDVCGIENDPAACATRRAVGLRTVEGSVLDYAPRHFPADGLLASPPCQSFSAAGNGAGRRALDDVLAAVKQLEADTDHAMPLHIDERTALVVEPLRWALAALDDGDPYRWLAFEQVPPVLPVWEAVAGVLGRAGYSTVVGKVYAEQYGVPQTRTRAVLLARLDGEARLPRPTHSRYYPHDPTRLDPDVAPFRTIREALGWDDDGNAPTGLRSNYGTSGDPATRGERTVDEPAAAVTSKAGRNHWIVNAAGADGLAPRGLDQPLATLSGKGTAALVLATGTRPASTMRADDQPAPTLAFGKDMASHAWVPPGTVPADLPALKANGHVRRLTIVESALLQTFPADYPWQGGTNKRYEQVGNAVPPMLARTLLAEVLR